MRDATNAAGILRKPIHMAVIDDHPLFRAGTIRVLTRAEGFEIVGEGATAADAVKMAHELIPDVILLDLNLPGGGVEAATSIGRDCPDVRTIVLTVSENAQDVVAALAAGVRGYILKGSSGAELIETVHAVVLGNSYVAPTLAARILINHRQIGAVATDNPMTLRFAKQKSSRLCRGACLTKKLRDASDALIEPLNIT